MAGIAAISATPVRGTATMIATAADERILDSTLALLATDGVAGVSMRAVARRAEVAVGLVNYHFNNKTSLICAVLRKIGEQDDQLVAPAPADADPSQHLNDCLEQALDAKFLTSDYLSLRLQLWSPARVDPQFAEINQDAQKRYLKGLGDLLAAARPDLKRAEVNRRAADILIEQNGVWLTAILITDPQAVRRAIERCQKRALG